MKKLLIFIIGLPCSGKSTVASKIAEKYGFIPFSTEAVRAEFLAGERDKKEDCDFTPEQHKLVYGEIIKRARRILDSGRSVIIDGVYRSEAQRGEVFSLLDEYKGETPALCYWLTCAETETVRRLIKRKTEGTIAPAGIEGYKKISKEFAEPRLDIFKKLDTTEGTENILPLIYGDIASRFN
ncbi:MAG: AAA family ATPase [Clostridia bacterium]|nr:AAA family ATPase [Clostridia bacterium]